MFKIKLWLAKYLGYFRHEGMAMTEPKQAYIVYPQGFRSIDMSYGSAIGYQKIFGGVIKEAGK